MHNNEFGIKIEQEKVGGIIEDFCAKHSVKVIKGPYRYGDCSYWVTDKTVAI